MTDCDKERRLKAAGEIACLEKICFPTDFWSFENIYSTLQRNDALFKVFYDGSGSLPIGYYIAASSFDEAELYRIGVRPEYRKKGCGKALMKNFIEACPKETEKIFLEVRAGNTAAVGLYEGVGFNVINRRKKYYGEEDGLIYLLEL